MIISSDKENNGECLSCCKGHYNRYGTCVNCSDRMLSHAEEEELSKGVSCGNMKELDEVMGW